MLALQCPHLGTSHPIILSTPPLQAGASHTRPSTVQDRAEAVAFSSHLPIPPLSNRPGSSRPLPYPFSVSSLGHCPGQISSHPPLPPPVLKQKACLYSPSPVRPLGAGPRQRPVMLFWGPLGLMSMLQAAIGQRWWAGTQTLNQGPKPRPASITPPAPCQQQRGPVCSGKEGSGRHLCMREGTQWGEAGSTCINTGR